MAVLSHLPHQQPSPIAVSTLLTTPNLLMTSTKVLSSQTFPAACLTCLMHISQPFAHYLIWSLCAILTKTNKSSCTDPGNPSDRSKVRSLHLFTLARSQLTLRRWLRGWQRWLYSWRRWLRVWRWHLEIAQTPRCRRQTHRWRWAGNPNGRSKFRNFFVYVSKITTNARAADGGWWRSFKRHIVDVENIAGGCPAMTRIDQSSAITKIYAYEIKQNLSKNIFLLLGRRYDNGIAHWFFLLSLAFQRLLFSSTKNNFSTILTPTEKPRYTYWRVFCRFYL